MKTYTLEELTDLHIGKKGTPARDKFDRDVEADVAAFRLGEAIREERKRMNLTQKQLGERAGIDEQTVSKAERGHATSLSSLFGIFRALNISDGSIHLGRLGRVALW